MLIQNIVSGVAYLNKSRYGERVNDRSVSDFSRRFALHLKGVMTEKQISQEEVAERLGRSKGYVSEHVSGKRAPDSDLIAAVADAAGLDPAALAEEVARRMRSA